jgi:hypothetical protein
MPKHTLQGKRNEGEHDKAHRALQRLKKGRHSPEPLMLSGTPTRATSISFRTSPESGSRAVTTCVCPRPARTSVNRSLVP